MWSKENCSKWNEMFHLGVGQPAKITFMLLNFFIGALPKIQWYISHITKAFVYEINFKEK